MKLLVEEGFERLTHRPEEDQSDMFANSEFAEA